MAEMSPRAFVNPIAVGVLGVGVVAGAVLHSVPVGALAAVTYLALVAWDLMSGVGAKRLVDGLAADGASTRSAVALPDPDGLFDGEIRRSVERIVAARAERTRVLADTPDSVAGHLGSALMSVEDLEKNAVVLVRRAEDLARWLATQDVTDARAEIARLDDLANRTRDPAAAAEYTRARDERGEHVRALDDVEASLDRIRAHLSRIAASLASISPKLVRMRALDAEAMDLVGAEVANDLAALDGEVRVFEQTLRSLSTQ